MESSEHHEEEEDRSLNFNQGQGWTEDEDTLLSYIIYVT